MSALTVSVSKESFDDKIALSEYAQLMAEHVPYITINLDLENPLELEDFVGFFGAVSGQFDRYMRSNHPDVASEARIFIKEVRPGSIIADLFPGGLSDIIYIMDSVLIVIAFADLIGQGILKYSRGERILDVRRAELKDLYNTVEALAKDTDGKVTVETVIYESGVWKRRVAFTFTSGEARNAAKAIEDHRNDMDKKEAADHSRVLMTFKRSDIGDVTIGRKSGERVIIESISEKDLPLIYVSDLAEQRIKHEIRDADENVYKKGFVVDVNVETKGGITSGVSRYRPSPSY